MAEHQEIPESLISSSKPASSENQARSFWERLLQKKVDRRQFIKLSGAAYIQAAFGREMSFFKGGLDDEEKEKREKIAAVAKIEDQAEREKQLREETGKFLEEYEEMVKLKVGENEDGTIGFGKNEEGIWTLFKAGEGQFKNLGEAREAVDNLMERGVVLSAYWSELQGESLETRTSFQEDGSLKTEGVSLAIKDNEFHYHLALSLIKTKLSLKVEEDEEKTFLLEDDLSALRGIVRLNPKIEVDQDNFIVMPDHFILSFARYSLILEEAGFALPDKFIISRKQTKEKKNAGFYLGRSSGSDTANIVVGNDASLYVVFHEGGHYLQEDPNNSENLYVPQIAFEDVLFQTQRALYNQALQDSNIYPKDEFDALFGAVNPIEDFAITFEVYCNLGPKFRRDIEIARSKSPTLAAMLEAKYEFMKKLLGGREFSFDGRIRSERLLNWEERQLAEWKSMNYREANEYMAADSATKFLRERKGFEAAGVVSIIPEGNANYASFLMEPRVWEDILPQKPDQRIAIDRFSALYPTSHFEIRGKIPITLGVFAPEGKRVINMEIDTENPQSLTQLVSTIQDGAFAEVKAHTSLVINKHFSEETERILAEKGIKPEGFALFARLPYDPKNPYVEDWQFLYLRLTKNPKTNQYETKPIDIRAMAVGSKEQKSLWTSFYSIEQLEKEDIILTFDREGKLRETLFVD